MRISILLVDDNEMFRKGVRAFLKEQEGLEVIGEAGSGNEALQMIEALCPDLVLLDWQMPGMSGLGVLMEMAVRKATSRAIILSMHDDEAYVTSAILHGAHGYVLKDDIVTHLPRAVQAAVCGGLYVSFSVPNINAV